MCSKIDLNQLVRALDKPIVQDPLKVLAQIQAYDDDSQLASLYEDTA